MAQVELGAIGAYNGQVRREFNYPFPLRNPVTIIDVAGILKFLLRGSRSIDSFARAELLTGTSARGYEMTQ